MSKIGPYSYPDYTLDSAVQIVAQIAQEFRGRISTSSLAKMLKMAEKSGTLFMKTAALRDYGLIEGRGELKVTSLAQRITHSLSQQERDSARTEAFLRVDLFKHLFDRMGDPVPDKERFVIFLEEITGADRLEVSRKAGTIRRIYLNGARYLSGLESAPVPAAGSAEPSWPQHPTTTLTGGAGFVQLTAQDIQMKLPLTADSIDILQNTLNLLRKRLTEQEGRGAGGRAGADTTPATD